MVSAAGVGAGAGTEAAVLSGVVGVGAVVTAEVLAVLVVTLVGVAVFGAE